MRSLSPCPHLLSSSLSDLRPHPLPTSFSYLPPFPPLRLCTRCDLDPAPSFPTSSLDASPPSPESAPSKPGLTLPFRVQRIATSGNAAVTHDRVGINRSLDVFRKDAAPVPGIIFPPAKTVGKSTNIVWQECMVRKGERQQLVGQKGCVIWITGLSGSGKSTLACALDHALFARGKLSYVLDGDNLRHGLNNNLGFSVEDRTENIRRVGEVAKLFVDAGIICIASLISPYRKERDACRRLVQNGEFIEVYMKFPLKLCEDRDPKGLYKLARAGKIKGFTGIDDPYEPPINCEVVMELIEGRCPTPAEMADRIVTYLDEREFFVS